MSDVTREIPKEKQNEAETEAKDNIKRVLGDNWMKLPITGPRMMVLILIANKVLVPYGITPSSIAETAIEKSKEYELDQKFQSLIKQARTTAEDTGEWTTDTIKEMTAYSEEKGKKIGDEIYNIIGPKLTDAKSILNSGIEKGKNLISDGLDRGKEMVNSLKAEENDEPNQLPEGENTEE